MVIKGKTKMKTQTFERCWVLQADVDNECYVCGILIKRTAKRYLVVNTHRDIIQYYKNVITDIKTLGDDSVHGEKFWLGVEKHARELLDGTKPLTQGNSTKGWA